MRKLMLVTMSVILLIGMNACQRDLSEYDKLLEPQISVKPDQNMLVIESKGDPNQAGAVMKDLFRSFYALKKHHKNIQPSAPRARWIAQFDQSKEDWIGLWALPLPDDVNSLTELKEIPAGLKIEVWQYGAVAEILHVGPYATEPPTIQKLMDYITSQGYTIIGPHEEEYLKGPTMFGKGNPEKYKTIIRYQVTKKM
ncbi:MAG: GyrI-like domain-containing protein [Candidatus Marinimicrobia bacterium]|nr:GyrI-like domain-containing protein [Candidatus Neomarinimicrobiota bacterium]